MEKLEVEDMEIDLDQLDCPNVRGVSGQLLLLPVVALREVLKHLPSDDCLNLSLVNKLWHREALSVLRGRGCFTAIMYNGYHRCKDLRAFASDLRRMKEVREVVPFSGLKISVSGEDHHHGDWCQESSPGEFDQICEDIVLQMEWKHLVLDLTHDWDKKEDCAGFQLVKKILHNRSSVLEEFSLGIQSDHEAFNQHFLGDNSFSCLKALTFWGQRNKEEDEDLIKALVSRAPNLKVLCTKSELNLKANLLEGRSAAVHLYDDTLGFPSEFQFDIPECIVSQLRVREMFFSVVSEIFNYEGFKWMVPKLLQQSRTTLSKMTTDPVLLVALMHYGICLENVMELIVYFYPSDTTEPSSRRLLKSCDFTHIFPNLRRVDILPDGENPENLERTWNAVIDMAGQGNAAFNESVNRTGHIKILGLDLVEALPDSCARFFVEMFPDIQKLVIKSYFFVRCWDYWLNLEELELLFNPVTLENLDSDFCGIFPQEVAHLREQDEEYLQKVNIVPIMPAFPRLKSLKIFFNETNEFQFDGPPSFLSKVTGFIAFKRHPELTVTLVTNSEIWRQELEQMEPYASVQLSPRPDFS